MGKIDSEKMANKVEHEHYCVKVGTSQRRLSSRIKEALDEAYQLGHKEGRHEIEKELMAELRDPNGTIWEHAKYLQDKCDKEFQRGRDDIIDKIILMLDDVRMYGSTVDKTRLKEAVRSLK